MDQLGTLFSVSNLPGHISYLLIAISYWLTEIFWLRVVAVVGLSLEILYFWHSGGDLRTGIGWDLIFILINLYQVYRLVKDRLSLRLPESDRELLRRVLTGLDDSQIARLLNAGAFCDLTNGTTLARENEALKTMFFICSGRARVMIGGREVSRLEKGSFVGEVAFLTDKPATATVIAEDDMRGACLRWQCLKAVLPQRDGGCGSDLPASRSRTCQQDQGQQYAACHRWGLS